VLRHDQWRTYFLHHVHQKTQNPNPRASIPIKKVKAQWMLEKSDFLGKKNF